MPGSDTTELRVFCTCGQKMKVSADMFGQPGKCIACRQKIRIPTPEQLPPNTTDVYLRDHPEFLRSPKRRSTSRRPTPKIQRAQKPAADKPIKITIPLDVLEPLQTLQSQAALLEVEREKLDSVSSGARDNKRDEVRNQRRRVRRALEDLREELRQRLMEVAIELTATQEKIGESNLSVRVGELDFPQYQAEIDRMRRRRDSLERRQQNLRGWIAVSDPFMAGGLRQVDISAPPPREFRVTFRGDEEEKSTSLEGLLDGLREALQTRSLSEERIEEFARRRGTESGAGEQDDEALAQATRERALAQIQFHRKRLDQRLQDYGSDLEAVAAQLDHARGRHQSGTLPTARFNELERALLRSKTDLVKGRDLIKRALAANSEYDVPTARGTFMQRLTRLDDGAGSLAEPALAWAAVVALLVALVLPLTGDASAAGAWRTYTASPEGIWLVIVPVLVAALSAAALMVPGPAARGAMLTGTGMVALAVFHYFFHETAYRDTPLSEAIRRVGAWYVQPGPIAFALGIVLLIVSGALMWMRVPGLRLWILSLPAVAVILCVTIATNIFGVRIPAPAFSPARIVAPSDSEPDSRAVEITVVNQGGRAMHLRSGTTLRNGYRLMFDINEGLTSWRDLGAPSEVQIGSIAIPIEDDRFPNVRIAAGQTATFTYPVGPGEYRASLLPIYGDGSIDLPVSVQELEAATPSEAEPVEPEPEEPVAEPAESVPGETPAEESLETGEMEEEMPVEVRRTTTEVQLRGIIDAPGRDPVFSVDVISIAGEIERIQLGLGEELFGGWKISEYNQELQTVTLSNEASVIVLRRGELSPLRIAR